jgi:very-short-patch-repair endonuclease
MNDLFDRNFVTYNLIAIDGNLNARALKKYGIDKEHAYQVYHGLTGPGLCKECQSPTTFISFKKGYAAFCSNSCVSRNKDVMAIKTSTLIRNYGEDGFRSNTIQNKKKKTSIANYGVAHPRQNKEYINALQQKFLKEHGVTNPANTEEANKKRTATNLERYGTENPVSNPEVYSKIISTNLKKYGVSTALLLPENKSNALSARKSIDIYAKLDDITWLEENKNIPSPILAESLNVAWSTVLNYYKKHNITRPHIIVSSFELKLIDFLKEHNIQYISSERTILDGKEIDIYLPEFKIGLEIDGLYWHSEHYIKDKHYHAKKTNLALEKGIQLIHITDYELSNKFEIVKNRILAKLGKHHRIFARKCKIVSVRAADYESFMMCHHIQGYAPASVRIGLEYEGELVALMAFSRARYNNNYEWELIRYATCHAVVGGASRLFSYFISTVLPKSVISYADLRWNTGIVYTKIGMTLSHTTKPNYWYIENGRLVHRTKYQKHKLNALLSVYDEKLSEWENMKNNGYTRYWDCGNKVFTWSN